MASLDMNGPYNFDAKEILNRVDDNRIGNYALGYVGNDNRFYVKYVGRSDNNVQARLLKHFYNEEQYSKFKFRYSDSVKQAFETECKNYHDFGGLRGQLNNIKHPDRPDGKEYQCPKCYIFNE